MRTSDYIISKFFKMVIAAIIGFFIALILTIKTEAATDKYKVNYSDHDKIYSEKKFAAATSSLGFIKLCQLHVTDCLDNRQNISERAILTQGLWIKLLKTNRMVNHSVKTLTGYSYYKQPEKWNFSRSHGDCKDSVSLKRQILIASGLSKKALLIDIVKNNGNYGHTVLTVLTNKGDFVLDNQNDSIIPWQLTNYRLIKKTPEYNNGLQRKTNDQRVTINHKVLLP